MDSWRWIGSYIFTIFFFCSSDGGGGTYEAASIIACWSLNQNISASYRIKDCDIQLESLPVALQVHRRCCLCVKHTVRKWECLLENGTRKRRLLGYWLLRPGFGWRYHKLSVPVDSILLLLRSAPNIKQLSLLAKWNMTRNKTRGHSIVEGIIA